MVVNGPVNGHGFVYGVPIMTVPREAPGGGEIVIVSLDDPE
jgi:hypothetical protein